jgi:hypothetical protein
VPLLQPKIRQDAAPPPFSATFPVSNPDNPSGSMALDSFPQRRKVRVTLAGNLTATHKENGGLRTTTPSGYRSGTAVDCTGRIYVTYAGNQGSYRPDCGSEGPFTSRPFVVQGRGTVFRDGYGGAGGWRCAAPPYDFCWTFSGTQQVTVEVMDYPGVLNAYDGTTPKTTIPANANGTYLKFKWTPVPDESDTPQETYNWWYVAVDGAPNGATTPSAGYQEGFGKVFRSGTMYVNVKINGVQKTLSRYIHVGPPTLGVAASPSSVYKGDSVKFTASVLPDSTTASGVTWWWQRAGTSADSAKQVCTAGQLSCTYTPDSSGTMRVDATLAGTKASATASVTVMTDSLVVACDRTSVPRGDRVRCVIRMASNRAFRIDRLKQETEHGTFDIDVVPIEVFPGPGHVVEGPAAVSTTISASATLLVGDSETAMPPKSARYEVTPRAWTVPVRPLAQYYEDHVREIVDSNQVYLLEELYSFEEGDSAYYGYSTGPAPVMTSGQMLLIGQGPNRGYSFLASPPALPEWKIWINPDLVLFTDWFADQNGVRSELPPDIPATSQRWCGNGLSGTPDDIGVFAARILRHEGWYGLQPSHYDNERQAMIEQSLHASWERVVAHPRAPSGAEMMLRTGVSSAYDLVSADAYIRDYILDPADILPPQYLNETRCYFDNFRAPSDP